ncbi:uncharacterized protein LOC112572632 [Pomacea canaliculata]|uniref:uncharacterized protein LOC112572632 n=1 Tax=Pomacea canaliculata TaxID=400727 RepID=UPI000D73FC62|nr:uncharacterized protein LOC112572632 [Pomacea canaliculata]
MSPGMDVAAWIRITICLSCLLRLFSPTTSAQEAQCTVGAGVTTSEDMVLQCSFKIHVTSFTVEHRRKSPQNETEQILVISCSPCKVDGGYTKVIIPMFPEDTDSGDVWRFRVLVAPETSGVYRCFGFHNSSSYNADCVVVTSHENETSDAVPSGGSSSQPLLCLLLLFLVPVVAAAMFFLLRRVLFRTLGAAVKASTPGASTTRDSSEKPLYLLHRVRRALCRRPDSDDDGDAQHAETINLLSPSDPATSDPVTSSPSSLVHSGDDSQLAGVVPAGGNCDNGSGHDSPEAGEAVEVSEQAIYENIPRKPGETWRDGRLEDSRDVSDDRVDDRLSFVSADLRGEVGTARDSQVWSIYSEVTDSIDV